MNITFLPSALDDLEWMKTYYETVFPAGKAQSSRNFRQSLAVIRNNPQAGKRSEIIPTLREHPISKTPFTLVYLPKQQEILIVHIKDQRSNRQMTLPRGL